jgi:hypothetical protein
LTGNPENLREAGRAFEEILDDKTGRIHDVNLLIYAGRVLGLNSLQAIVSNPHYPDDLIPFDIWENSNFRSDQYGAFFREMIQPTQNHNPELIAVICDKCLAQVNGLLQSLTLSLQLGICDVPCLNHIVQLVFTHILEEPAVVRENAI